MSILRLLRIFLTLFFLDGFYFYSQTFLNSFWSARMLYVQDEEFVVMLEKGIAPHTHHVRGSNYCLLNVFEDRISGRAIVISVVSYRSPNEHINVVVLSWISWKYETVLLCDCKSNILHSVIVSLVHADMVYWCRSTILSRVHRAKHCRTWTSWWACLRIAVSFNNPCFLDLVILKTGYNAYMELCGWQLE
jgi:hypothetical protein